MIVDVDLQSIKKLGMTQNGFLLYEGKNTYELYYANKGPIVFRSIIKKDKNGMNFLMNTKIAVRLLSPLKDTGFIKIEKKLDDIFLMLRLKN